MNAKRSGIDIAGMDIAGINMTGIEPNASLYTWDTDDWGDGIGWLEDGQPERVELSDQALRWVASVCREISGEISDETSGEIGDETSDETSDEISDENKQWQTFLRAMAIAGVDQWLHQSAFDISITYADRAPGPGVNAQVGNYRLCILPTGPAADDQVVIPASTIQADAGDHCLAPDPSAIAHLYCLVEVHEEYNQVRVRSGLRQNQLQRYLNQLRRSDDPVPSAQLEAKAGENLIEGYAIPVAEFTVTPEQVLLYFNTLDPEAMMVPTPSVVEGTGAMLGATTGEITGAIATTVTSNIANSARNTMTNAVTNAIDVGRWLSGQIDELAAQLGWQLIPPLVPSQGFLPVRSELETVMDQLERQGVVLPPQARGRMNDIEIGEESRCRLYAWVWPLALDELADPTIPEWSLFILVGPTPDDPMPQNLELVIWDEQQEVVRSTGQGGVNYVYAQAIGSWAEQFWVQIDAPGGERVELPPFQCTHKIVR